MKKKQKKKRKTEKKNGKTEKPEGPLLIIWNYLKKTKNY